MKTYILLFGITGDLSKRMLLPSLEWLLENKKIEVEKIYGVSRRELDVHDILTQSLKEQADTCIIGKKIVGVKLSDNIEEYINFKNTLNLQSEDQLLIYLSVPPANAMEYVKLLGEAGINTSNIKLMLEKPFGTNLESAKEFLNAIDAFYNEQQVYKIDHYLAKQNSQALIEYRKQIGWDWNTVSQIEIIATETLDIQGRGVFYEQTGALCDFIQGHLMELLLLTICDLDENILQARAKAIKSLSLNDAIRGQYIGYKDEVSNNNSCVETYASVELNSNIKELQNIKLKLTTGKALSHKESSIKIYFNDDTSTKVMITPAMPMPNSFVSREEYFDGYKGVFHSAINSNKIPFSTNVEILTSWNIFKPILTKWANNDIGLILYKKGSSSIT